MNMFYLFYCALFSLSIPAAGVSFLTAGPLNSPRKYLLSLIYTEKRFELEILCELGWTHVTKPAKVKLTYLKFYLSLSFI